MKKLLLVLLLIGGMAGVLPTHAQDQISYTSQPEEVAIFLNDIAFVHDNLSVPGNTNLDILLPATVYPDTIVLREGEQRVSRYSMRVNEAGQTILQIEATPEVENRGISLEYLMYGLGWTPLYDMTLADEAETVQMDFSVQIHNYAMELHDVAVKLVAGRVDAAQQLDSISTVTTNQMIAGYDQNANTNSALGTGAVTIQHIYEAGSISSDPGETMFLNLLQHTFPARRVLLWNAAADLQATVIYKVRNDSELPLPEGIVHTYKDGLFTGSDFVEVTPIGGEGSVTVGGLQDLRVRRSESQTLIDQTILQTDMLHEVSLELTSFSDEPIEVEVVDPWRPDATDFVFSDEPQREANNLLRWVITIPPGETITITYEFKTEY
jgi:hypothetical protein